ncbi:MAG: aminotransferase class V-fold PLP-dependent enzyme, partial [Clostridiales bacterium]|nr:aminotransferase class V-fold PLP-dependent enzyme [Clostridiales bacterium]
MPIYFDHAATTAVRPEVLEAMIPFFSENYGNPSSVYSIARSNKKALELAREQTAAALNADPIEIFFTGSGTEADNWAIIAGTELKAFKGKHVITSAIEHHAVLHTCRYLQKKGIDVTYLPVSEDGVIRLSDLEKSIRPDTVLISIMTANNEIGSLQPIAEIGQLAKNKGILFHTDA